MTDERLRVLLREYRYAAYDVGARGKKHGRGEALEAAEAALVAYIEEIESILTKTQENRDDPNVSC